MSACAVAAAMLFAATPAEAGPRVVVVVQGDGADAGRAQASLEDELDKQGIRIIRNAGPKIGAPAEPPLSTTAADLATAEIKAAQTAYDAAEFEAATQAIDRAKGHLATTTEVTATDARVQMLLWAASIKLAAGKPADAEVEVKTLVRLDPDVRVSTDIFPQEVAQMVEANRPKDLVSVTLSSLPDGAIIVVTPPGALARLERAPAFAAEKNARIRIRASHYRPVEVVVPSDVPSFAKPVKMALALRDDGDKAMRGVLESGGSKPQITTLSTLATQAGADALVLVAARGTSSRGAVVWARGGEAKLSKPGDAGSVTRFVAGVLRPSSVSGTLLTEDDDGFFTSGGVAVSTWNRNLDGVMQYALNGAGPAVSVDFRSGGVIANAGFEYVTFSLTPIEIDVTDGSEVETVTGEGGTALRASLDAGYDVKAGPVLIGALVGGRFEQYSMTEVIVDDEAALGSSTYSGGLVRLRVLYPLGPSIRLSASAGAVVAPSYAEDPKGTSGTDPQAASAPFWRVGASWQTSKMRFGFDYAGETRSIALDGPPAVDRFGNADQGNLTLTEMVNTFSVTAAYHF